MNTEPLQFLIQAAIKERRLMHLLYDGKTQVIEPHFLGHDDRRDTVLLCRQVTRLTYSFVQWQVIHLKRMYGLMALDAKFSVPVPEAVPENLLRDVKLYV